MNDGILDTKEVVQQMMQRLKKNAEAVRVENGCIMIKVQGKNREYAIELDRCNTPKEILSWAFHLSEKTWMDTEILREFIRVAAREAGIKNLEALPLPVR